MLSLQNTKQVIVHNYVAGTGAVTGLIDTLGFSEVQISVYLGTLAGTNTSTHNLATVKLSDCDTSNGTYTDITASIGAEAATSAAWAFPYGNSSSDAIIRYHLAMGGQYERYIMVTVDPVTSQGVSISAQLARPVEMPDTATKEGVVVHVNLPG